MRCLSLPGLGLLVVVFSGPLPAQAQKKSEEAFVKEKPAVGDILPNLTVYSPAGKEVHTAALRGQYAVLTFGCLT
jgi:hypothetical protein